MSIRQYLDQAIDSFRLDPADDDFQRGYLAALETIRSEAPLPAEDAAVQIGEDAFRAGFEALHDQSWYQAWSNYDPPEHIKDLVP